MNAQISRRVAPLMRAPSMMARKRTTGIAGFAHALDVARTWDDIPAVYKEWILTASQELALENTAP